MLVGFELITITISEGNTFFAYKKSRGGNLNPGCWDYREMLLGFVPVLFQNGENGNPTFTKQ